jgi:SAM-dependent methyltransferase
VPAHPSADSRWERFAREDPLHYIDPSLSAGMTIEEFAASGEPLVASALAWAAPLPTPDRAVEIGCGVGRFTSALATRFALVDAVDVSPTMIALAGRLGLPDNVELHVGSGRDLAGLPDGAYDLAFSHLVFQHVPDGGTIAGYLREVARVLTPAGVAVLQFDTRPASPLATAVHALPDPLLPRLHRRGARRHRLPATRLRGWIVDAGLELTRERGADTAEHWVRLARAAAA